MQTILICVSAVVLDRFIDDPRRRWLLERFRHLARRLEAAIPAAPHAPAARLWGAAAALALVLPVVLVAWGLSAIPFLGVVADLGVVYLALGAARLGEQSRAVDAALREGDLEAAWTQVEILHGRDFAPLDEETASLVTVEWILRKGNDALLGVVFWFLAAGAPGVAAYRLVLLLDGLWGYRGARYRDFGWAVAWGSTLLNWIPARLTALSY
ncbi:MAG: cobalamin biosynthesis protein, partial [Pseudomonadota bacterium]|nr:cobalamin biosynthesis protein [Pseudomonadota bacterium]